MTKSRTVALRGALLTGACVAACAASTGSADAASCTGASPIAGQGSTLQNTAQSVWAHGPDTTITGANANKFGSSPIGCSGITVNYNLLGAPNNITGSQAALNAWGADGTTTFNSNLDYLGTDDAPTSGQITNIKGKDGGSSVVVVPVAQTAIAVTAHPPSGCTLNGNITHAALENVFNGTTTTWASLGTGSGCSGAITRVVRSDGSGTTNNFEEYFQLVKTNPSTGVEASLQCTGSPQKKWSQLRAANPNTTWPQQTDCQTGEGPVSALTSAKGGGGVASAVDTTAGTIGYAALPDAEKNLTHGAQLLTVDSASAASGSDANCANATYTVPAAARSTGSGVDADWSGSYGNTLTPASGQYGICALTYDIGLNNYSAVTSFPAGVATSVKDYLGYVVNTSANGGQVALSGHYYNKLPTSSLPAQNVQGAAAFDQTKIG